MSMTAFFEKIVREEGVSGLFKGYRPKIIQSVLTAAVLFLSKERLFDVTIFLLVLLKLRKAVK